MRSKKLLALTLSAVMSASLLAGCGAEDKNADENQTTVANNDNSTDGNSVQANDNKYGLVANTKDGAILHCFAWSFKTIEESMEDIAMAGYSTIQTSPINECYDGGEAGMELFGQGKWFYHYQPTDWTIGNYQLGTKDEFKSMCAKAHELGIKVLVDVAPNHTTTNTDAINKNLLDAVGGIDNLYHSKGKNSINDYSDRTECTLLASGGLFDVNTENPKFQDYFIAYLNDCIACGADGFRYDTAKHIGLPDDPQDDASLENNFWERVTTEVTNADTIFEYGEVLQDGGERIADYINAIGATTASTYGSNLRGSISNTFLYADKIANFNIGDAEPNVVTWVESHDNYTTDDGSTYTTLDNTQIKLAYNVIAARGQGTPLFFARPYGASAESKWGTFNKIGMVGDNLYKDSLVVASNRFRNAMVGLDEKLFNAEDNASILCIERGTKGLNVLNASKAEYSMNIETSLEDGTYTDRVSGETYTVADGKLTGKIGPKTAVILYNDGYVDIKAPAVVKVDDATNGNFTGESLDVTLIADNATSATYSIDGGAATSFNNGDIITIGKDIKAAETTVLTLKAENEAGNTTTISYIFKKLDTIGEGDKIYFKKPASWGDNVNAYIYDETSYSETKQNKAWPGAKLEKEADGTYSYTFEEEWIAPLVIFSDGQNQYPRQLEPGAVVVTDKVYEAD